MLTRSLCTLVAATAFCSLPPRAVAGIIQTNYGTVDGTVPGPGSAVSGADLLQTHLASASRTGAPGSGDRNFYREDSGYPVVLGRLTDGLFGTAGGYSIYSVLPNQVTLTFALNLGANPGGYTINSISSYASWDSGRDGQAYTVEYALASAPTSFLTLAALTPYNIPNEQFPFVFYPPEDIDPEDPENVGYFDTRYASTLVTLTSSSGPLAEGVGSLRFVFGNFAGNVNAFENGGTAYREFDVIGAPTALPEPGTALFGIACVGIAAFRRRRNSAV